MTGVIVKRLAKVSVISLSPRSIDVTRFTLVLDWDFQTVIKAAKDLLVFLATDIQISLLHLSSVLTYGVCSG